LDGGKQNGVVTLALLLAGAGVERTLSAGIWFLTNDWAKMSFVSIPEKLTKPAQIDHETRERS